MLVEYGIIISCDVFFKVHAIVTDQRRRYSACYVHTASEQANGVAYLFYNCLLMKRARFEKQPN